MQVTGRFTAELEKIVPRRSLRCRTSARSNGYSFIDGQTQQQRRAVMFWSARSRSRSARNRIAAVVRYAETPERPVCRAPATAIAFAVNPPSIPGLGTTGGFEFYVQNRGAGDPRARPTRRSRRSSPRRDSGRSCRASARLSAPTASSCSWTSTATRPRCSGVKRRRCVPGDAGVTSARRWPGQFSQFSRVWFVIIQADADYRARPEDFGKSLRARRKRREHPALRH